MLRASVMGLALALVASTAAAKPVGKKDAEKAPEQAADKTASAGEARRAAAKEGEDGPNERYIEKRSGEYLFKLTLRPGTLQPMRVANVNVEVLRILEIPDPQWGDRLPMKDSKPIATVQAPAKETKRNRRRAAPPPARYVMWPITNPGEFGFHFSPEHDGLYTLSITGIDPTTGSDALEPQSFDVSFRLGVGTESAQTEQSQGTAATRRTARRPVGSRSGRDAERELQMVMEQIGDKFLDLEDLVDNAPKKGPNAAAAAEARVLASLFAKAKGLTPKAHAAKAADFDGMLAAAPALFEALAVAAEGKDRKADRKAFEEAERNTCLKCHTAYRWNLTKSLAEWPEFKSESWK